jgi:hypothetical protein
MSNIIRDRKTDLVRAFEFALEQCAACLDDHLALPDDAIKVGDLPKAMFLMSFEFPQAKMEITAVPEVDLRYPFVDPTLRPAQVA